MKVGGVGALQGFWYINLSVPVWFDSQNDKSKELNRQRGVTVQIALQISEYCTALASGTVNEALQTPRLLKVGSDSEHAA